jgi:hypothetical protein
MTLALAGLVPIPPELLPVLVVLLLLWDPVHRLLLRLTTWCFNWGAFRAALALTRVLERLPLAAWMRPILRREELYSHSALGRTE